MRCGRCLIELLWLAFVSVEMRVEILIVSLRWKMADECLFSIGYGVQAWIGGNCIRLMISSIWPSFENVQ